MKNNLRTILACGAALFAIGAQAANVTVSDSIVSLATNGTKNYTFTDSVSGQSATVALTITPFSTDPLATLVSLDGDTRVGVGNVNVGGDGNLVVYGEGVTFSASLVSASVGVVASSVQFRVSGLGVRAVSGAPQLWWASSATASNSFAVSGEAVVALDAASLALNGATYAGRLDWVSDSGEYQLSDAGGIAGLGLILNASFNVSNNADPRTNSWYTANAGKYARIYTTDANKTNGVSVTTWSNGSQTQATPAYVGVQEIYSSSNWVYIRTTGLGTHTMGPWYNDVARTTAFVNMPANQKAFYRFPRTPLTNGVHTTTTGEVGYMVDGVKMFDSRDAVSYINSTGQDGVPPGGGGSQGDGIWNRDAYVNEATTFDPSLAHQQNTGVYHYHASPLALRYMLGDNVDFNPVSKAYTPNTNAPLKHSPIIAWANDGYPIYGPFGYSNPMNASSGVRRMVSGFVLRDGSNGTTNLNVTGRTTLAAWAQRAQARTNLTASQYGPAVSSSFPLGRYVEDNDYLGDLGQVQGVGFDLDEYNCRFCVTPEFPNGTYAYFNTISASGAPTYPYNVGRQYYGVPTAGNVTTLAETVVTNFVGGPGGREVLSAPTRNGDTVVLKWSAVEGGTYRVEASTNLTTWTTNATGIAPLANVGSNTNTSTESAKFFRINRTALATYDSAGGTTGGGGGSTSVAPGGSAARNTTVTVTITLPTTPPWPPANAPITSVTLAGSIAGTSISDATQGQVVATFVIPSNAPTNAQNVVVTFNMGPTYTLTGGFTINP